MRVAQNMSRLVFGREASTGPHSIPWVSPVVVGRVLLATIFVVSGVGKIMNWSGNLAYMQSEPLLAGMPWLLAVAAAIEVIGGLSILTGTFARLGAIALVLFLIPTTVLFHDFWALSGAQRELQMSMFLKNLSIMGGLLLVVGFGAGQASVDEKIHGNGRR